MSEQSADDATSLQQPGTVKRNRENGEGEEKPMLQMAEEMVHKGDKWQVEQKAQSEGLESPARAEVKQAKVQSVFSLVRSQIRAQTCRDTRRTGMLQLVQRVTRQLDRSKGDQGEFDSGIEVTSAVEGITAEPEAEEETREVEDNPTTEERGKEEVCVALLQEVLCSLESMRKEVRDELSLLRLESQSYTEQALKSLEARLTHTLSTHTMPQALSRPSLVGPVDVKKHKPLTVPSIAVNRRRTLCRTMTSITPKSCPQPGLGPRSMSEPLGGRAAERVGSNSSGTHMFFRGRDPLVPLEPLPPAVPHTQNGKKILRNKTRAAKAVP